MATSSRSTGCRSRSPKARCSDSSALRGRQARGARALEQEGLSGEEARRALLAPPLPVETLDADAEDREEREFIALAITLLLYGQLLTYGFWVAIGVVEEKSSRVVEILLSAIRPRQLLAGKVLGIGLLGAAQLLLVVVAGVALALLAAVAILLLTIAAVIGFAARVYERAVMRTGKPVRLREALR